MRTDGRGEHLTSHFEADAEVILKLHMLSLRLIVFRLVFCRVPLFSKDLSAIPFSSMFRAHRVITAPRCKFFSTSPIEKSSTDFARIATRTGFRQLLRPDKIPLIISLLNSVVPTFTEDNLVGIDMKGIPASFPISNGGWGCPPQVLMSLPGRTKADHHIVVDLQIRDHPFIPIEASRDVRYILFEQMKPFVAVQLFDYDPSSQTEEPQNDTSEKPEKGEGAEQDPPEVQKYTDVMVMQNMKTKEDYLFKLITIDLHLASQQLVLFPPSPAFTMEHWWLSLLKHSSDYTRELVEECTYMPEEIRETFGLLDLREWRSVTEVLEYKRDLQAGRPWDPLVAMLEAERAEGKSEGRCEGKVEVVGQLVRSEVLALSQVKAVLSAEEGALLTARLAESADVVDNK